MRYTVQPTETLTSIAEAHGHSGEWQVIAQLNPGVDPGQLAGGLELELPDEWAPEAERAAKPDEREARKPRSG